MRHFLNRLIKKYDLSQVDKLSVNPAHEIGSHVRKSCDVSGPALLCSTPSYIVKRVIGGLYGTENRVKMILDPNDVGITNFKAVQIYDEASSGITKDTTLESKVTILNSLVNTAPCREVIIPEHEVNLYNLPICTHNEHDSGPFITAGVQVVRWLDGKTHGLGIHRMRVVDKNHLSCLAPINRRVGLPYYRASDKGESIKMAVVIGGPPSVVLASQAKLPFNCEKYIVAANIEGDNGIKLVRCVTNDLLVPAEAEMVIECESIPGEIFDDTPFAEYPGTYSYRTNSWKVKVTAITMRKDCIYNTILTGRVPQEDSNLCAIPMAAEIYRSARNVVEEVTDVSVFLGNNVFDTIVCVRKNSNEEIHNLILTLLGNRYVKSVSVMNHDLKATEEDWRFAFNTRYQPDRDTTITGLGLGASLDPSSPLFQSTSKVGFDLTYPIGKTPKDTARSIFRHQRADAKYKDIHQHEWEKITNNCIL